MYASKDEIFTIEELRNKLAVKEAWKSVENQPTIREYEVIYKEGIKARSGLIGPQLDNGVHLSGGGHQYEFIEYLGSNWKEHLKLISTKKLK